MADPKRILIVTGCSEITKLETGTLYEVFANDQAGVPVPEKLRSFVDLTDKVGQEIEFEISPYTHPRYGTSYTLKPPGGGGKGAGLGKSVDDLRARVEALESQLRLLLSTTSPGLQSQPAPAGQPASQDEDIPF